MLLFPNSIIRGSEAAGLVEFIKGHNQKNNSVRVRLLIKGLQHHNYSDVNGNNNGDTDSSIVVSDISSIVSNNELISHNNVEVRFASPDKIDTNTALIIADGEKMMTIEFDEMGDNPSQSSSTVQPNLSNTIRFATHTNSESAIISHRAIFERLWIESAMKNH